MSSGGHLAAGEPTERPPFATKWGNIASMKRLTPLDGIEMFPLAGEKTMINFVRIAAGAEVPTHHHPHEQCGTVIEGEILLTVGDETRALHVGDAYVIPPHMPHSATSTDGCLVVDIFSPPREDYRV